MTEDRDSQERPGDPRVYFAAERTLLAWVRTGLAMMGFGFVVARFGLFLQELAAMPGAHGQPHSGLSTGIGTTLIILGVTMNLAATVKHWRTVRRLERGEPLRFGAWSLAMTVALLLGLVGLLMAVYLISRVHSSP